MSKTSKIYKTSKKSKTYKTHKTLTQPIDYNTINLSSFEKVFSKKNKHKLTKTNSQNKAFFVKQLLLNTTSSSIKPNNDFYNYINSQWLKNVSLQEKQKYIVELDDFRLAQDKVYRDLYDIITDYIKNNDTKLSRNMKMFYDSIIKMNSHKYTRKLGQKYVSLIDDYINKGNAWQLLGYINTDEMLSSEAPFNWYLAPDGKDNIHYRSNIASHQFTILDISVYYDDGINVEYKKKYREKYYSYCKKIFDTILGPNNGYNSHDVFDVEVEMFNTLGCLDITKNNKSYNKVYADEALTKYNFDWNTFSKSIGFNTPPKFFITNNINYLKCGSDLLLKNWNSSKWKTYWLFILFRRLIRLTKDWEKITYDFYGNFERGESGINTSNAVSSALYMSLPFNSFLTDQYVAKFENPKVMEYAKTMCEDLKIVFQKILENTWLAPSTKKYAIKKLQHFKFVYGKQNNIMDDPNISYSNNLYDNMIRLMNWRHKKFIELEGKTPMCIPVMNWNEYPVKMAGTQAYIVNASYTPSKNSIFINLGYLQKPFVDLNARGLEYNLAHLGFTIGHEMSHGFDDWGSQYGYDGNLYDWWTDTDKKKYKLLQADVINQYEQFAKRDNIVFDATIGVGEDLADISGMAICDRYLKEFQESKKEYSSIRKLSYETFYTYFAIQQKQKISKKAISAQLKTNPHPLDKYRCNIPLSRSQLFRSIFDVKKQDDMWWHNTNTIW